ncbi:hypothetical protein [Spirosoma arcticum]
MVDNQTTLRGSAGSIRNRANRQATLLSVVIGLLLLISLTGSLFFKERWLWMDEVLSYILLSDPSRAHMNEVIVSGLDSNPPVYFNFVWTLAQGISLNEYFLRSISIALFAATVAVFYRYTTRLIGTPLINFILFTAVISLTYLNFILSDQIRPYGLYLLMSCLYFITAHQLVKNPSNLRFLGLHFLAGSVLVMTHNFGSFYVAASLCFFAGLYLWSRWHAYWWVAASHLLIFGVWIVLWYANFQIQALVGKPYSWIPEPTVFSFFQMVGELIPTLSSRLEQRPIMAFLPILRVALVLGLFLYIAIPRVKRGFQSVVNDDAFSFYLLAGCIAVLTAGGTVVVSYAYLSVFLPRYQWPSHLLLLFQLVYAFYHVAPAVRFPAQLVRFVPLYVVLVMGFVFYQNRKIVHFPSGILDYLPRNEANYPIFFESSDYFLPIWHHKLANAHYLMHRKTVLTKGNLKNSSTDYNLSVPMRERYDIREIVWSTEFTKERFPRFYIVDESSRYQAEYFIANKRIKVLKVIPVPIEGHRILECVRL